VKLLTNYSRSLQYAALGTGRTLTAVPRSTQPSTLRGTVNESQPNGRVLIHMAMSECSVYSSLQADSNIKFAAWPMSWRPLALTDFRTEDPEWTLAYGWRV